MITVLFTAWHAGGAKALKPVIAQMRKDLKLELPGHNCTSHVAYGEAINEWQGLNPDSLETDLGLRPSYSSAMEIIAKKKPKIIVTGTSIRDEDHPESNVWEKQVIYAANNQGIPTIAVVDAWTNLVERFSDTESNKCWAFLPTKIAVPDRIALEILLEKKCPENIIVVTGNPYHDRLYNRSLSRMFTNEDDELVRATFDFKPFPDKLVTYFSTPVAHSYGATLGYDEKSALQDLLEAVRGLGCQVLVRLHPQERLNEPNKFDEIISHETNVRVDNFSNVETIDLVLASDVVCSTHSSVLVEAAMVRKLPISLQGGKFPDKPDYMAPFTDRGAVVAVYDRASTHDVMRSALFDKTFTTNVRDNQLNNMLKLDGMNTAHVVNLVYKTLALHG